MQKGDVIYRQQAIDVLDVGKELLSCALDNMDIVGNDREKFEWGLGLIESYIDDIKDIPSAQPETHDKRTETHACDLINRQQAIDYCEALMNAERLQQTDDWGYGRERYNQTECIMHYIENIPSA